MDKDTKSEALTRAKSPKLGRFLKEGGLAGLHGSQLAKKLENIGKAFKTAANVADKTVIYTPEENTAYREEMMKQIAIEKELNR